MADTATQNLPTELVKAQHGLREGQIVKLADLVKAVAPPPELPKVPEDIPLPAVITKAQTEALETLAAVYGQVVPTERRALTVIERAALREERETLDQIEGMAKKRKESIRTAVLNDLDVAFEEACPKDDDGNLIVPEGIFRNDEGHWVEKSTMPCDDGKVWERRVSAGSVQLDPSKLLALAEDDEYPEFTRKDYLAMTEQVRVVDELKAMMHLKKNPALVSAIRKATTAKPATLSLYLSKEK
jgi:hypothetical protein